MTEHELAGLGATEAVRLLRQGAVGAQEYVQALLKRIEQSSGLNAMIHVDVEGVLAAARRADQIPAQDRGALHGLPLIIKDNIDVAGMPCTAGSPALADHRPSRDADCVAPLRSAGALMLGKANLHEFALGVTSGNARYGAVRNPHALGRIAGGSSGGTAAAIAAGLAPAGLGTDTGGSIRIPAALCGVVGFRPSTGRWPSRGVVPISVPTRDTAAPMARSVEDCALLDGVVCKDELRLRPASARGLRLGLPGELWSHLHAGLREELEAVLETLRSAGVELVPVSLGFSLSDVGNLGLTVAMYENLPALRAYFADHSRPFDARAVASAVASPDVKAVMTHLLSGDAPGDTAYANALLEIRTRMKPAWERAYAQHSVDALLMPTTPVPAGLIGEDVAIEMDGLRWPTFETYVSHCGPATLLGLPSLSLPAGHTEVQGVRLPVGLMVDGPRGADRHLLSIGALLEPLLSYTPVLS